MSAGGFATGRGGGPANHEKRLDIRVPVNTRFSIERDIETHSAGEREKKKRREAKMIRLY
jgi:hypothetical protein